MRVTIVGSGVLLPDDEHRSAGHLVESGETRILLDCGSGVVHGLGRDARDWRAISHVAISHFHTDHLGDLPALFWAWTHGVPAPDQRPRTLLGPPGIHRVLESLSEAYGEYMREPGAELTTVELGFNDSWADPSAGLSLRTCKTPHTDESIAYRIELPDGTVGYTGDTGPHDPLGPFFDGPSVLISECSVPRSQSVVYHLSPPDVAKLALAAQPDLLVLTHLYPNVDRRTLADVIRSLGYDGEVRVADDGLTIETGEADPAIRAHSETI